MKSKYLITLFLIGILPVAAMLGVYGWTALQASPSASTPVSGPALHATAAALQTQDLTLASSIKTNIEITYQDMAKLVANHSDTDLSNFVASHPGVSNGGGIAVFSAEGKLLKSIPATAQLADPGYGSSDEFKNMMAKFKENGGSTYLFYTRRLSFPAFVFSVPLDSHTVAQAVLNLSSFFGTVDPRNGEISLIDADSGQFFYSSNLSKLQSGFNPGQDPWLAKLQQALAAKQSGSDSNPPNWVGIYTSLGLKSFGIVRLVPFAMLQPAASKAPTQAKSPIEGLQEVFTGATGMPLLIAAAACLGWIFLVGLMQFGSILSPLRKASAVVLNAAKGTTTLTPDAARKFGNDEVGQMVQASAMLLQKLQDDKQQAEQEKEEALRRGRAEVDAKTKEAAGQVAAAQQQAQAAKSEVSGLNQQLADKLKELDALKSMSEGLRNQTEQSKAEIGKLKSQVTTAEDGKAQAQKQMATTQAQLEGQLKEMESKLLSTVAASSAIQVSSVRAAAIRTMAEELKTTLGIIKGYVSSALGTGQGGINEKQQEFLGMVINRSARLEKFINDLVDIYQVEIEQEKATHEEVNLASEIEGLAFNFQPQAEVKNIKMKVEAKGTVPKVPIIRRRFNQLWNILYLQIIKDAPRGSSIPIMVEAIGENVKVTVQDPGLTVTAEALPRLFDEFYDPKHTASPQLAGTGLKFALIKTILAANGGGAVAEKADPGTKLILTFPTKIKKPGEAPVAAVRPAAAAIPSVPPAAAPTAAGLKPPAPPALGMPKPPPPGAPGATPGVARPSLTPPPIGMPKPAAPMAPTAASAPAAGAPTGPKPPDATSGLLDSLISKVPSVTAPGVKPPVTPAPGGPAAPAAAPGLPKPPSPLTPPGLPTPGAPSAAPKPPMPGMPAPAAGAPPAAPKPPAAPGLAPPPMPKPAAAAPGLLDSLIDKKVPVPPPATVLPVGAPKPAAVPPVPGIGAPKPVAPPVPGVPAAPPVGGLPKPPVPGAPAVPGMAPKPLTPPGIPTPAAPAVPKPPMPGIPAPGVPAAPKVVPTNIKPTTPPPGVLDLDSMMDGLKTDAGAPKPAAAPALRPPVPGAPPMGIPGAPKAPAPGVPPGGLDASKAQQKPKDGEGELIE